MARNEEFLKIPEAFPFSDVSYQSITGETSTLHRLLRRPAERGTHRSRRRSKWGAAQWKPEDKANLVKIFDDPSISQDIKKYIEKTLAIHPSEIDEYRRNLTLGGLAALEEQWAGQKLNEYPASALTVHGPLSFNPLTGDVRYGENFALLGPLQSAVLNALLQVPSNTVLPLETLREEVGVVSKSTLDTLRTKLQYLSGKELLISMGNQKYAFLPLGALPGSR